MASPSRASIARLRQCRLDLLLAAHLLIHLPIAVERHRLGP